MSLYEYIETVPTLWSTVRKFFKKNPQYLAKDNLMGWLSDNNGKSWNLCHMWSNFEIGSLNFFRSEAYEAYFDTLDATCVICFDKVSLSLITFVCRGGFYYEVRLYILNLKPSRCNDISEMG